MTTLTGRRRTAVNAALGLAHSHGHDANAITRQARTIMATGRTAQAAYEAAFADLMRRAPELSAPLAKVSRLIMSSDDASIAQYDRALSAYMANGDEAPLNALAPMIARDSLALAIRSGELPSGAAGAEALATALGGEVSSIMVDASVAPSPAAADVAAPAKGAFAFMPVMPAAKPQPSDGTGYMTPTTAARWAAVPYTGRVDNAHTHKLPEVASDG